MEVESAVEGLKVAVVDMSVFVVVESDVVAVGMVVMATVAAIAV